MKTSERTEAMIQRAKELAAQGRYYQIIKILLVMEGFAEASDLLSHDLISELRQTAEAVRKDAAQGAWLSARNRWSRCYAVSNYRCRR
jgi:hypothetical protein